VVWGLACGGQTGVAKVLKILHDELRLAMMLNGCRTLSEVTRDLIFQQAKL
jgi:isopentenyl diphosphate isomerase/L-lactate dehydrogenase-like FMN-dependent dehydrogenase